MNKFLVLILLSLVTTSAFAQSGRTNPNSNQTQNAAADLNPPRMYDEVNGYTKKKTDEFQAKKIPYNETLYQQTLREQKQLAARYAAQLAALNRLNGEDFYYLGMLYWLSGNTEATIPNLELYLKSENLASEKQQSARSVMAVIAARKKDFPNAEKFLAEYLNSKFVKPRERAKMESELAIAYRAERNFPLAAAHAAEAYRATKNMFRENPSRARALADLLDSATAVFEIYTEAGDQTQADATLEDLRRTAALVESTGIYYYAIDTKVKYMIETNRRAEGMKFFADAQAQTEKDFSVKPLRDEILRRLKRRSSQYELLGKPAPELVAIERSIPNQQKNLTNLRGKVIMLDFWATWCGPCIALFPHLTEWYENYHRDGLEILGVTRYYGQVDSEWVNNDVEYDFLQRFRQTNRLPYDFLISKNDLNYRTYSASAIPTTVLIDRQGIVRYVDTGTGKTDEIKAMIEKLLAEK